MPTPTGPITATVSVGAVVADGELDADRLVEAADKALYCAKKAGRNRVELTAVGGAGDGGSVGEWEDDSA